MVLIENGIYLWQEGVAVEIAKVVLRALVGELSATTLNAPMVPAKLLQNRLPTSHLQSGRKNWLCKWCQEVLA
ncbi:hypothetical protein M758_UG127100 [Ceratodon purpureus]|nr:hypothetical protein M758_UG127100 [Ceratodon purpureus]